MVGLGLGDGLCGLGARRRGSQRGLARCLRGIVTGLVRRGGIIGVEVDGKERAMRWGGWLPGWKEMLWYEIRLKTGQTRETEMGDPNKEIPSIDCSCLEIAPAPNAAKDGLK